MYLLAVTIIALSTVIAWMVVETISVKREMKQLTDDYLKPKNDSFINPNVETKEMFEDLELDPISMAVGVIGGVLALVVMSKTEVGLIYKIGSFIGASIACYFMVNKMRNQG